MCYRIQHSLLSESVLLDSLCCQYLCYPVCATSFLLSSILCYQCMLSNIMCYQCLCYPFFVSSFSFVQYFVLSLCYSVFWVVSVLNSLVFVLSSILCDQYLCYPFVVVVVLSILCYQCVFSNNWYNQTLCYLIFCVIRLCDSCTPLSK